jgi:hypothetical protein
VVDRTVQARDEVRAAAGQVQNGFLPDVADTLTGAAPEQRLRLAFPDFFRGLDEAPGVLARYDERVAIRIDAFPDRRTLKKVPLTVLAWAPLGLAALLALAAVFVVVRSFRIRAATPLRA